jgi:hypothetical protein
LILELDSDEDNPNPTRRGKTGSKESPNFGWITALRDPIELQLWKRAGGERSVDMVLLWGKDPTGLQISLKI